MPNSTDYLPDADIDLINLPVTLPNGVVVPNRLVKAAMEEGITGGLPGKRHCRLYRRWGAGGWGVIITGNVQVDSEQLATAYDLRVYDNPHTGPLFTELHDALLVDAPEPRPLTLVQLSHAGIQSSAIFGMSRLPWSRAVGPVAARPSLGSGPLAWAMERILWPLKSRAVTDLAEWLDIATKFIEAAATMEEAGWGGVQVHSAHGYLLAEYLSPLTNPDPHPLPGVPEHIPIRLHLLWLILTGIHACTDRKFVKAIKINCSDFVVGGLDERQSSEIIREIVGWGLLDILEVSGGTYTNPAFTELKPSSTSARESLFAYFTSELLPTLPPPPLGPAILLTGGLHDRTLIAASLRTRACDLAGIGRPAALMPDLPSRVILNPEIEAAKAVLVTYDIPQAKLITCLLGGRPASTKRPTDQKGGGSVNGNTKSGGTEPAQATGRVRLVGAGIGTVWHEWQMFRIGRGEEPDPSLKWLTGAFTYTLWYNILKGGPAGWWDRMLGKE